jgi:predicted nucleic acid-binding Zn ribbon protein
MNPCPHCAGAFKPRRSDQVYCSAKCRHAAFAARKGDGALRARISKVSILKGGKVSVVVTFLPIDRAQAAALEPGRLLEIVTP